MGSTLSVLAPSGQNRTMKVVGIFPNWQRQL